jgi:hypothetical protein
MRSPSHRVAASGLPDSRPWIWCLDSSSPLGASAGVLRGAPFALKYVSYSTHDAFKVSSNFICARRVVQEHGIRFCTSFRRSRVVPSTSVNGNLLVLHEISQKGTLMLRAQLRCDISGTKNSFIVNDRPWKCYVISDRALPLMRTSGSI